MYLQQKNSNLRLRIPKIAIAIFYFLFYPYPFGGPYLSFARFLQCSVYILLTLAVRTSLSLDFFSAPFFILLTVVVRTSLSPYFDVLFRSHFLNALAFSILTLASNFYYEVSYTFLCNGISSHLL